MVIDILSKHKYIDCDRCQFNNTDLHYNLIFKNIFVNYECLLSKIIVDLYLRNLKK